MHLIERIVLRRFLRRKAIELDGTDDAERIRHILESPLKLIRLNDGVDGLLAEQMSASDLADLEVAARHGSQASEGRMLEMLIAFLNDHWQDIMEIIVKLLGL